MKIKKLKTLNEAIEEIIDDGTYSVMDHNLASSVKREAESKEKAIELFDDKTKESALEDRDAHSKVSTPALKKMYLSESLFEEYEEKPLNESLYDDILKEFPELKGKEARLKAILDGTGKQLASAVNKNNGKNLFDQLGDFFPELNDTDPIAPPSNAQNQSNAAKYTSSPKLTPEEYADLKAKGKLNSQKLAKLFPELNLSESINGNTSHAQDFVSALRSAGFGDGFDQKLKIDTYGNGGTRVEYKDQGGTFTVTITDDKVVLEGQDEGDAPFKKEFSTWEEFASEFESLYPGIPVRENKILVESKSNYSREDIEYIMDYLMGNSSLPSHLGEDDADTVKIAILENIYEDKALPSYLNEDDVEDFDAAILADYIFYREYEGDSKISPTLRKKLNISRYEHSDAFENPEEGMVYNINSKLYVITALNDEDIELTELVNGEEGNYGEIISVKTFKFNNNLENGDWEYIDYEHSLNESLTEASYTRSDNKKMLVKPNRDPLVDVIQLTLTDGEWGYVKSPDGTVTPSLLPHLSYNIRSVGVSFDSEGRYFVRVWDVSEESLQKVAEVAKQFNREYKIGFDKYAAGSKKWYCLIYLNEDTDFDDPYVDPEAEVNKEGIKGRGTKLRGNPEARHARDNEDLEDSQRYPIESPAPAQTGLAMMEDISVNGSLMEDKISMDMIHDFKPQEGAAEETFNRVLEAGKMETLEFALEDRFPNGVTTEELNKVLSDEAQWIYNQLGMKEFIIPDEDDNQ